MNFSETAALFSVDGERLVGIAAQPETPGDTGVLLIVGGPQYRVGSHRQFLLLSRRLAGEGYPVFRFDYRGMGDSSGAMRDFAAVGDDVRAAVDAFRVACPSVRRLVLWGLCDAASAALLYLDETRDAPVAGLVLLNPWVRSEASLAQTHLKHYYGQRLLQKEFWIKLLSGRLGVCAALRGFFANAAKARGAATPDAGQARPFQQRMADGWRQFAGRTLLILSGDDYTAREFVEYTGSDAAWKGLVERPSVSTFKLPEADHTFSAAALREQVEDACLRWLGNL